MVKTRDCEIEAPGFSDVTPVHLSSLCCWSLLGEPRVRLCSDSIVKVFLYLGKFLHVSSDHSFIHSFLFTHLLINVDQVPALGHALCQELGMQT